jgi:hypothetical protein
LQNSSPSGILIEYEKADLVEVLGNDVLIAYEIELNPQSGDIPNQVLNDFKDGFSQVVVLAINKEGLEKIKKRVYVKFEAEGNLSEKLSQIKFALLKDYLDI